MRTLVLVLSLCSFFAVHRVHAAASLHGSGGGTSARIEQAQLQLTTSIVKQYPDPATPSLLRLVLKLTYTNTGKQTILLDKKSSLIYRSTVSKSLKAAAAKKYENDVTSSFIDLRKAGLRVGEDPAEDAFVILQPGASYSLETLHGVMVYDCTKDSEDYLRPGTHFLQLRVATWYYLVQPEPYREKWRDKGYLWSQNMTSLPMQFTVETKCTSPKR